MKGVVPWPKKFARRYKEAGYWEDRLLGDYLEEWCKRFPDKTAIVDEIQHFRYDELILTVDGLADYLISSGVRPKDRFVLQLTNSSAFVIVTLAMFRAGAIPILALPAHRQHEIAYIIEFSDAVGYVGPASLGDFDFQKMISSVQDKNQKLKHVLIEGANINPAFSDLTSIINDRRRRPERPKLRLNQPEPDDVALFLLSGGTTGLPKLIPRTHNDYSYNVRQSAKICQFNEDTIYLVALPAGHNFPFGCPGILGTLSQGGCVVMAQSSRPARAFKLIEKYRVNTTAVVPAVAISWMQAANDMNSDLSSLELLQVGGARLNPEIAKRVLPILNCQLQQVFGMAEGLLNYTRFDDPNEIVENTQGRPMCPDDEIKIVDLEESLVSKGEAGELLTRGPYTIRGYYSAPEHNRRAFTNDGFYRTGDVVREHPSGNLIVEGRVKDLINRGGEKISAEELENLILAHEAISNVAVIGMPDDVLGERICVYAVTKMERDIDLESLISFLEKQKIAKFKLPERLEIVESLPLTNVGKVDKKKLRDDIIQKLSAA